MAYNKKGSLITFKGREPKDVCRETFESIMFKFEKGVNGNFEIKNYSNSGKRTLNINETMSLGITVMDLYSRYYESINESYKDKFYNLIDNIYDYVVDEIDKNGFYLPVESSESSNVEKLLEFRKEFNPNNKEKSVSNYTLYNSLSFLITYIYSYRNDPMRLMISDEKSDLHKYNMMFEKLDATKETKIQSLMTSWFKVVKNSAIKNVDGMYVGFGAFNNSPKENIYYTYLFSELFSDFGDNILGEYYNRHTDFYEAIPKELILELGIIRKQITTNYKRSYFPKDDAKICKDEIGEGLMDNIYILLTMVLSNSEFKTNEYCEGISKENKTVMFDEKKNKYMYETGNDFDMEYEYIQAFEAGICFLKTQIYSNSKIDEKAPNRLSFNRTNDYPEKFKIYKSFLNKKVIEEGSVKSFVSRLYMLNSYYVSMMKDVSLIDIYTDIFDPDFYNKENHLWSDDQFDIMATKRNLDFINDFDDYKYDFELIFKIRNNDEIEIDADEKNDICQNFDLNEYIEEIVDRKIKTYEEGKKETFYDEFNESLDDIRGETIECNQQGRELLNNIKRTHAMSIARSISSDLITEGEKDLDEIADDICIALEKIIKCFINNKMDIDEWIVKLSSNNSEVE